jgi:ketosteroid isomerase-like protein
MSTTTEVDEFLEAFIPRQREADQALHRGDVGPRMQLYSHNDPVTLLGAFGVAAVGWERVSQTFEWVASRFSDGHDFQIEVIAAGVSGDLAYTVGYETSVVSVDGAPPMPGRLRVTHVYRRENGEWKIVHRHGDRLESNAAPSSR